MPPKTLRTACAGAPLHRTSGCSNIRSPASPIAVHALQTATLPLCSQKALSTRAVSLACPKAWKRHRTDPSWSLEGGCRCRFTPKSRHVRRNTSCPLCAKSGHRLKCFMDCRRELSVPGYFMAAALPPPGIVICVSAGIAALPSFLKVGWSWDDAITSAP